jgi:AbrB family looped-hinge helix DNA binding protein
VPRISTKNQVTIPVAALEEAGLRAGDQVVVEVLEDRKVNRGAEAQGIAHAPSGA